jgi:hypothetical protein
MRPVSGRFHFRLPGSSNLKESPTVSAAKKQIHLKKKRARRKQQLAARGQAEPVQPERQPSHAARIRAALDPDPPAPGSAAAPPVARPRTVVESARPPPNGDLPSVNEPAVYTIPGFCRAHDISVSMFHKLRTLGLAPEMMCVGARRLISVEAAARWRADRERSAA